MSSKKGSLIILSAPSGTGKTVLVDKIVRECPAVVKNVSYTTRPKREDEVDGVDYFFVTPEAFLKLKAQGAFLEDITLFNASYATSKAFIEAHLNLGEHVILVIDTEGALRLRQRFQIPAIFLMPPSLEELRRRLEKRGEKHIEERLKIASQEMDLSRHYDYIVVNDSLEEAANELKAILVAEELRVRSS